VGNLHVNFTILVYSPTRIISLFYPISKFSHFAFAILHQIATILPIKVIHLHILLLFAALLNSLYKTRVIRNSYFCCRRYGVHSHNE